MGEEKAAGGGLGVIGAKNERPSKTYHPKTSNTVAEEKYNENTQVMLFGGLVGPGCSLQWNRRAFFEYVYDGPNRVRHVLL